MRRSRRRFLGVFLASLCALAATAAGAQQRVPAPGVNLNLSALSAGAAADRSQSGASVLSGLSLNNLSLTKPTAGTDLRGGDTGGSSGSRQGNITFDMAPPQSTFTPYIGLGFGGAAGKTSDSMRLGTGNNESGADSTRAVSGVAGFAYEVEKGTKLDFGYRFANTQRPNAPVADNLDIAGAERDRAAVLSLRYELSPSK